MASEKRTDHLRVAIFRHSLGELSEPYIARQASLLPNSESRLFGIRHAGEVPGVPAVWLGQARLSRSRESLYKLSGNSLWLENQLRAFAPDVLLSHFATDGYRIRKIAKKLDIPHVVMCHGSDVLMNPSAMKWRAVSARQLRGHWDELAAGTYTLMGASDFICARLRERGVPEDKIMRHYLGVNVPETVPSGSRNGAILFVGRLEFNKGCHLLVEAAAPLIREGVATGLTIVGHGSQREHLGNLVNGLGLRGRVTFAGSLPHEEVNRLMLTSSLLCAPSVEAPDGSSEGLGLASLEAQARRLPVVVTRTGGLPETIGAGGGGWIADPRTSSLRKVLNEALQASETELALVGQQGRAHVLRQFNELTQIAQLASVLSLASAQAA